MKVKICGMTSQEDALKAAELGAWAVGYVFWSDSRRFILPKVAGEISRALPREVQKVGVFVNPTQAEIDSAISDGGITLIQLHGDEPPELCSRQRLPVIKAFHPKDSAELELMGSYRQLHAYLIDAAVEGKRGGTGKTADWTLARDAKKFGPVILSGGISPANILDAIEQVAPFAIDLSSGVESAPGKKDHRKMAELFETLKRGADPE